MRRDAAKAKVTLKRWDEWHLCWHEDVELHHGNPAQFDLIKLRSEFSRLCWRLVTIRSRLLQRWNDKLDNTCQVSFVVLGERYCDLYKGRSKVDFVFLSSRWDKTMFFVILFLSRKLLSLIRMVSTSEAIVWETIFVRIPNGFQDKDRKVFFWPQNKSKNYAVVEGSSILFKLDIQLIIAVHDSDRFSCGWLFRSTFC